MVVVVVVVERQDDQNRLMFVIFPTNQIPHLDAAGIVRGNVFKPSTYKKWESSYNRMTESEFMPSVGRIQIKKEKSSSILQILRERRFGLCRPGRGSATLQRRKE